MQHKLENTAKSITWQRAPLALAVAVALGSPALAAQTPGPALPITASTQQAEKSLRGQELFIIDGHVDDISHLIQSMPYNSNWVVLDPHRDGLVQLAEIAGRYQNIRALHLFSHGEDGLLKLGNSEINQQNLIHYRKELNTLAAAMTVGGDLLLYGCEVAKTDKGEQFIRALSASTGLDVAASNDISREGDWELEIAQGDINSRSLKPEGYSASLDIISRDSSGGGGGGGYFGGDGGAGGGFADTVTGTSYADVIFGDGSGGGGGAWLGTGGVGGGGADTIHGGAGDDILFGDGFDGANASNFNGGRGGFGGGGGGGSYSGFSTGSGGTGGLFAGDGGDSTYSPAYGANGNNSAPSAYGKYSSGGAGAASSFGYGGGGGGWNYFGYSTGGNGAYNGVNGTAGDSFFDWQTENGGPGSVREAIKAQVDAGYFAGLPGGAGIDILNGGPGSDDLFGMGGNDSFRFEVTDAPVANNDTDTIHDFATGDVIGFMNIGSLIGTPARDDILAAQQADVPAVGDRTLVFEYYGDKITVVVKGVGTDLLAADVPANPAPNSAPTVAPVIDADAPIGGTFTVSENQIDPDSDPLTFSYQWKDNGVNIGGATGSTFSPTLAQAHSTTISVAVSANDGQGGVSATVTSANATVTNSDPVVTPTISGTPSVGATLTAAATNPSDADGDPVSVSAYQWRANGGDITGATSSSFTITTAQAHATITVAITATDGFGGSSISTSAGTVVLNNNPSFASTPLISGTPAIGATLSLTNTGTSDSDGDTVTLSYQWKSDGNDITGATGATFAPTSGEAHTTITCTVTADDGFGGTKTTTSSGVALPNSAPTFTATPTITGTPTTGSTLSVVANTDDVDGDTVNLSYQWHANGTDIVGATSSTYTLTAAEVLKLITVTVSGDDGQGGALTPETTVGINALNSDPTFDLPPEITGTATTGSTLSLLNTATTDADGDTVTLTYQWKSDTINIAGATADTFSPTPAEAHTSITAAVTATDTRSGATTVTTAGVALVNSDPVFTVTPSVGGAASSGYTLSVVDTASTDADGDTVILGYQWQLDAANIAGATSATYLVPADSIGDISVIVTADDGHGGTTTVTTAGATIGAPPKPPAAASGAMTGLSWLMGLLIVGARRLSRKRQ